jgi:FecR protein
MVVTRSTSCCAEIDFRPGANYRRQGLMSRVLTTALVLFCLCGTARAATMAGSVVGLGGLVTLDRAGQRTSPRLGDPVYVDDTLEVPQGAKLKLKMSDGSILSLAPGTVLKIDAYAVNDNGQRQSAVLSLGQGLLRSVTAPVDQPAGFEVNTAIGNAGARSTDWFVEAARGYQQVAVLTGSIVLTSRATGGAVTIPAGWGTRLDARGDPKPPRVWSRAEFARFIARTEGATARALPVAPPRSGHTPPGGNPYPPVYYPPPAEAPNPPSYYPPPAAPPYPPGYYPPPGIQIPIPGGGGYRPRPDGNRDQGGRGSNPPPRSRSPTDRGN